jgi:hypothetical protein
MFKKLIIGAGILLAVVAILGTSYGALSLKKAKGFIKRQIAPETKVDLIREEIAGLDQEMKKHISAVAEEMVAVDNLRTEIARGEENHRKQLDLIKIMRKDIAATEDAGEKFVMYDNKKFSLERVKNKLAHDWENYKKAEETLKSQQDLLKAREVSLTAVTERVQEMRNKKEELEVQLAQLEADIKNVRLAQSRSEFHFDDSKFGDIQKEMTELRDWIRARQIENEVEGKYTSDAIPVGKKNTTQEDLFKEIDAQLEKASPATTRRAELEDRKTDGKLSSQK